MRKSFGSSMAGPKLVLVAMKTTHTIGSTMARTRTARAVMRNARCDASTLIPRRRYPRPRRDARALSRIEDVAPGLSGNVCGGLDLEAGAGDREAVHLDQRARGARGPEEVLADGIDGGTVVDVEQVDGDLDHVCGSRAGGFEDAPHEGEDLMRLGGDVVADHGAVLVHGDDAGDVERVPGEHRVGVVAEGLGQPGDAQLAARHSASRFALVTAALVAARISARVWRGVIASGSTRSSTTAGRPQASAASSAGPTSSSRSTTAPWAPKALA